MWLIGNNVFPGRGTIGAIGHDELVSGYLSISRSRSKEVQAFCNGVALPPAHYIWQETCRCWPVNLPQETKCGETDHCDCADRLTRHSREGAEKPSPDTYWITNRLYNISGPSFSPSLILLTDPLIKRVAEADEILWSCNRCFKTPYCHVPTPLTVHFHTALIWCLWPHPLHVESEQATM